MTQNIKKLHFPLSILVDTVRRHNGVTGKKTISQANRFVMAGDPIHGPGDDDAVIDIAGQLVIGCGEAISPPFFNSDPYGAGVAAILANVNDVAAMGGVPKGVVNTIIGPKSKTDKAMQGMQDAAEMYQVPIIGGHLTESEEACALSAFALGHAEQVLSMAHVAPGQALLFTGCLEGKMREDFPFFTSIENQRSTLARDVRLLARVAASGAAVAAKDVSMAGSLGSLAMLLEFTRCGAQIDMTQHPIPKETDPIKWLLSFPTFAFWLTAEQDRVGACIDLFESHDLVCAHVGDVTKDPTIVLSDGTQEEILFDLSSESITGLWD